VSVKNTICGHFTNRIYGERAEAMTEQYLPDQSNIRSICQKCIRARGIALPAGYADLGGLARCSCCAEIAYCRDPDVLLRYAKAGIPPSVAFYSFPLLRHPLSGDKLHMSSIEAFILAATGGDVDD